MLRLLAIAATLSSPAASPPAAPRCVTRQQIGDISVVTMASMVETARNACRPHLPATAFLATPAAAEFSGRLRAEARQRLISAVAGITRMAPATGTTPEAMRTLTEQGLAEGTGAEFSAFLNPALCGDISEIMEISAELSPDPMGRFFGAFGSLVDTVIRIMPPGLLGPGGPSIPPPPPGARPASFDLLRTAPTPAPETSPPPIQPFLCRTPE
jgi:hypothetical protein